MVDPIKFPAYEWALLDMGLPNVDHQRADADIGRFLSADPHIQDTTNLQNWNRYSYVLNNPLSYTDPSGFFFNKIFKAIGNFFSSAFRAIGGIIKKALANPIVRAVIQIIACNPATAVATCVSTSAALALAGGGGVVDAIKAAAFAFAVPEIFTHVGTFLKEAGIAVAQIGHAATALVKGAVHGVIGGAISVAQGGNFLQGFAGSAIGAATGVISDAVSMGNAIVDTAIVAAAGCAGAVFSGGKCANGAVTAAFANMYNKYGGRIAGSFVGGYAGGGAGAAIGGACAAATAGACAPAIPAFTLGGSALGRFFGAVLGSWTEDWVLGTKLPDDRIIAPPGSRGQAPVGDDEYPVELHHNGQKSDSELVEMTRTDHRLGDNFRKNHHNTGKEPSNISRKEFARDRRDYWSREWDNGRFNRFSK